MSRLIAQTTTRTTLSTPGIRALEQVYLGLGRKVREVGMEQKTDVYQLGNLLLYLLTGNSVDGQDAVNPEVVREAVKPVKDQRLRRLILEMLMPDPVQRPTIKEVIRELYKVYQQAR